MVGLRRKSWVANGLRAGILAAVAVAPGADRSSFAAAPEANAPAAGQATAKPKADPGEVLAALRNLRDALAKDAPAGGSGSKAKPSGLPSEPARAIVKPTIDAAGLDAMLGRVLAASKVQPGPATSDVEFVRRVYLDTTGQLPTPEQVLTFCQDQGRGKRAKLVDELLASPDFAQNWARYWRDVIKYRAPNPNPNQVGYPALEAWLTEQFEKNTPWDEVARNLIAARGRTDENGAVAFGLGQMTQAVELAGEVSRVFMGVQIQCAQCHDHPNDPWKREQFHEFAAYFTGLGQKRHYVNGKGNGPAVFELTSRPKARYTMPDLKDPQKQIPVNPKFFLEGVDSSEADAKDLSPDDRRALAARLVTSPDNPWFAKAFVNRVWSTLMGEAFVSPIDDLGPTREPNAPEVFDELASQWQRGGYDVRWLFRTVMNTQAYQRRVRSTASAVGRTPFAANCASRLRGDQIYDALVQALDLGGEPGGRGQGRKAVAQAGLAQGKGKAAKGLRTPRAAFEAIFGVDPSTPDDDVLGTIPQALFLMNSPIVQRGVQARNGTVLGEILAATPDNRAALDALYLRVLARKPTAKEVQICGSCLDKVGDRREAFEDIYWALINTTEFVSRR